MICKGILAWLERKYLEDKHYRHTRDWKSVSSSRRRFELLEDRRMLATLTVNVDSDGDIANDGDLMLREAVAYVNGTIPGAQDLAQIDTSQDPLGIDDIIEFDALLNGETINLLQSLGELSISDDLTIDASALADGLTINAGGNSRVIDVSDGDLEINGLTLTGGSTSYISAGGAIRTFDNLTIKNSVITGNTSDMAGGGIAVGDSSQAGGNLTIENSVIENNYVSGGGTNGGGIHFRGNELKVVSSTISGNSADVGNFHKGGGLYATATGNVRIEESDFVANTVD